MTIFNQKTFEKLLTAVMVVSILMNMTTPVFAENDISAEPAVLETPVNFPEIQDGPVKAVRFITVTAYSSDVWQNDATPFIPANGMDYRKVYAEKGDVRCIALNDLPLGSIVRFQDERVTNIYGKKPVEVCDRKNAAYNGRWSADMYTHVAINEKIDSKESLDAARKIAKQFGVKRKVKIEILRYGKAKVIQIAKKVEATPVAPQVVEVNQSTNTVTLK